jgi:branched-subunit amino acid ABC-type transport system permease component
VIQPLLAVAEAAEGSGGGSQIVAALATGVTQGAMIALVALGYTMVYGVLKLINFAHS